MEFTATLNFVANGLFNIQ